MQVQATYPNQPEVIVVSFPRESQQVGILPQPNADRYLAYMANLGNQIRSQQLARTHLLQMDGNGLPVDNWCAAHPSAAAHKFFASEITDFIQDVVPGFGNSTFPSALNLENMLASVR